MKYLLTLLLALSLSAEASSGLSQTEQAAVDAGAGVVYDFALLLLKVGPRPIEEGYGLPPFVCWPFPLPWEDFRALIQDNVQTRLDALSQQDRKKLGENIRFVVRQAITEEYGCF